MQKLRTGQRRFAAPAFALFVFLSGALLPARALSEDTSGTLLPAGEVILAEEDRPPGQVEQLHADMVKFREEAQDAEEDQLLEQLTKKP